MEKRDARLQGTSPAHRELHSWPELQREVRPSSIDRRLGCKSQQPEIYVDKRLGYPPLSAWREIQSQGAPATVVVRPSVGSRERRHAQGNDFEVPAHDGVLKVEHVAAQANACRKHLLSRIGTHDVNRSHRLGTPNRYVAEKRRCF